MLPENIEQRGQRRVTESPAQRVRRNRINHVKPNLILPLRRHDDSRLLVAIVLPLFDRKPYSSQRNSAWGRDAIMADRTRHGCALEPPPPKKFRTVPTVACER